MQTLRLDFGEHAVFRIAVAQVANGTALPLPGLTLHFGIRVSAAADELLLEKTSPSGGIVLVDGVEGAANLTLVTADTEGWWEADDGVAVETLGGVATKTYWWDVWTFDGAGEKQPLTRPSPIVFTRGVVHP